MTRDEAKDKGQENGSCNRAACQRPGAIWYNHGSHAWYCQNCRSDIEFDPFNKRDWDQNWFPKKGHPMFETREMMDARQKASTGPAISMSRAEELAQTTGRPFMWCVHFLEAQAEGKGYKEAAKAVSERNGKPLTLKTAGIMREIMMKNTELSERDAEKDGRLWSALAAIKPHTVAMMVVCGRISAERREKFELDHEDAVGFMETSTIGTIRDARSTFACAVNTAELTMRFV